MIIQLNPPIPLTTPKGDGLAWFMIDYGPEHHLMWVVAIDATGELWTYSNPEVLAQKNITMGRKITFPKPSDKFKGAVILDDPLAPHRDVRFCGNKKEDGNQVKDYPRTSGYAQHDSLTKDETDKGSKTIEEYMTQQNRNRIPGAL